MTIFFTSLTDQKVLQEEVERARLLKEKRIEALGHMAEGLAHEINNRLAIIRGRASNILQTAAVAESLPSEEVRKAFETMIKTSDGRSESCAARKISAARPATVRRRPHPSTKSLIGASNCRGPGLSSTMWVCGLT
jgi:signal transduction histidine kinase